MKKVLQLIADARAELERAYPADQRPPFIQAALGGLQTANEKLVVQGALETAAPPARATPPAAAA